MYDPQTILIEQRIQDIKQDVEQAHLARQIRSTHRKQHAPFYGHALSTVGHRLITWGEQLQDSAAETPRRRTATTSS